VTKKSLLNSAQGSLDGLCGIYAIINACNRMIEGRLDYRTRSNLFCKLTSLLDDGRPIGEIVHDGIDFEKLGELIDVAGRALALDYKIAIKRSVPWETKKGRLNDFWRDLRKHVNPSKGRVALLGIEGKHSHWTVVTRVTDKSLGLADSSELKRLDKSNCSLTTKKVHQLYPTQTYFLTAVSVEKDQ
jgi:hypothetical protein